MRKVFVTLIIASLTLSLVACGNAAKQEIVETETIEIIESVEEETTENTENIVETKEVEEITIEETSFEETNILNDTQEKETVWVNTYSNVRKGPGTNFDVLGTLNIGDEIIRISCEGKWSKIYYNDEIAYIHSSLVQTTKVEKVETIVQNNVTETTNNTEVTLIPEGSTMCVGVAKEIFDLTNQARINAGLNPLVWSDTLASYADIRAGECITTFSHTRPDGSKAKTTWGLVKGENIIRGPHATAQEIFDHWMASEGHKANILYPDYTIIGIGTRCVEQGDTGCQLFGW